MKLGWLVWRSPEDDYPIFYKDEDFSGKSWEYRVVRIVYAEIEEPEAKK